MDAIILKMQEFLELKKKIEEASTLIESLKVDREKIKKKAQKQKEELEILIKEEKDAKKVISQNQRLLKERNQMKERLEMLLDHLEKMRL